MRAFHILSTAALLAALATAGVAHAATISVSYWTLSSPDTSQAPPIFAPTLGSDGLPTIVDWYNFSDIDADHGWTIWGGAGSYAYQGTKPTPIETVTPTLIDVSAFPYGSAENGDYTAEIVETFNSPSAATSALSVESDGTSLVYLNGNLILDQGANGSTYTSNINESLFDGSNTLVAFFADVNGSTPVFDVDPSIPVATAPATPEAATWIMMALGAFGMWFYTRRRGPRLATIGDSSGEPFDHRRIAAEIEAEGSTVGRMSLASRAILGAGTVAAALSLILAGVIVVAAFVSAAPTDRGVMDSPRASISGTPT